MASSAPAPMTTPSRRSLCPPSVERHRVVATPDGVDALHGLAKTSGPMPSPADDRSGSSRWWSSLERKRWSGPQEKPPTEVDGEERTPGTALATECVRRSGAQHEPPIDQFGSSSSIRLR